MIVSIGELYTPANSWDIRAWLPTERAHGGGWHYPCTMSAPLQRLRSLELKPLPVRGKTLLRSFHDGLYISQVGYPDKGDPAHELVRTSGVASDLSRFPVQFWGRNEGGDLHSISGAARSGNPARALERMLTGMEKAFAVSKNTENAPEVVDAIAAASKDCNDAIDAAREESGKEIEDALSEAAEAKMQAALDLQEGVSMAEEAAARAEERRAKDVSKAEADYKNAMESSADPREMDQALLDYRSAVYGATAEWWVSADRGTRVDSRAARARIMAEDAVRKAEKGLNRAMTDASDSCIIKIEEAEDSFWAKVGDLREETGRLRLERRLAKEFDDLFLPMTCAFAARWRRSMHDYADYRSDDGMVVIRGDRYNGGHPVYGKDFHMREETAAAYADVELCRLSPLTNYKVSSRHSKFDFTESVYRTWYNEAEDKKETEEQDYEYETADPVGGTAAHRYYRREYEERTNDGGKTLCESETKTEVRSSKLCIAVGTSLQRDCIKQIVADVVFRSETSVAWGETNVEYHHARVEMIKADNVDREKLDQLDDLYDEYSEVMAGLEKSRCDKLADAGDKLIEKYSDAEAAYDKDVLSAKRRCGEAIHDINKSRFRDIEALTGSVNGGGTGSEEFHRRLGEINKAAEDGISAAEAEMKSDIRDAAADRDVKLRDADDEYQKSADEADKDFEEEKSSVEEEFVAKKSELLADVEDPDHSEIWELDLTEYYSRLMKPPPAIILKSDDDDDDDDDDKLKWGSVSVDVHLHSISNLTMMVECPHNIEDTPTEDAVSAVDEVYSLQHPKLAERQRGGVAAAGG